MERVLTVFSTETERRRWNTFVHESPGGHLLQTCEWGDYKAALGWRIYRIGVERDGQIVAGTQMLLRPLPLLPLSIAYIPKGPLVDWADEAMTTTLLSVVHQVARHHQSIFLKIEPNLPNNDLVHTTLSEYGFRPSDQTNQPRTTLIVNLAGGAAAVWAGLRHETRKLVRRAAREGVEITEGNDRDIEDFHRILRSTARLKELPGHTAAFYEQAWEAFQSTDAVRLLLARHRGQIVAGKMVFFFGDKSFHFWGGTSQVGRQVHASYLLQWVAIQQAIARGCRYTDLWGIPDEIGDMLKAGQEIPKDRRGGLWGVYLFKRGFGGKIECYIGAYDFPYWSFLYRLGTGLLARDHTLDTASRWLEDISGKRRVTGS